MANRQLYELTAKAGPTLVGADLLPIQITDGSVELAKVSLGDLFGNITSRVVLISPTNTYMDINSGANSVGNIAFQTNGSDRWYIQKNAAAESGANVGSDFVISSKADDGLVLRDDFFIKRDTGNVGIGTTTPEVKLHVKAQVAETGGIRIDSFSTNHSQVQFAQDGILTWWMGDISAVNGNKFQISQYDGGSLARLTIDRTGNVGIGTDAPETRLQVYDNVGATRLFVTDNIYHSVIYVNNITSIFGRQASNIWKNRIIANESGDISFENGANGVEERMRITTSGNVGIGISAPNNKLTVNAAFSAPGGVTPSGAVLIQDQSFTAVALDIGIDAATAAYSWLQSRHISSDNSYFDLALNPNGGNVGIGTTAPAAKLSVEGDIQIRSINKLNFSNTLNRVTIHGPLSDTLAFGTSGLERMRITAAGNVGIGTDAPTNKLQVENNGGQVKIHLKTDSDVAMSTYETAQSLWGAGILDNQGGYSIALNASSVTTFLRILSNGNVGIGENIPPQKLSVKHGDNTNNATRMAIAIASDRTDRYAAIGTKRGGDSTRIGLAFMTSDNADPLTQMVIEPNGNVGIGTVAPDVKLEVVGDYAQRSSVGDGAKWRLINNGNAARARFDLTADSAELLLRNASGEYTAIIRANGVTHFNGGNVGIGIYTPTEQLHVAGNVLATNFLLSSDMRDKTKVQDLSDEGEDNDFKYFTFTRDGEEGLRYGVSAQQVQEVAPELVREGNDGKLSVAYIDLLIREVARLSNEVKELKNRG